MVRGRRRELGRRRKDNKGYTGLREYIAIVQLDLKKAQCLEDLARFQSDLNGCSLVVDIYDGNLSPFL